MPAGVTGGDSGITDRGFALMVSADMFRIIMLIVIPLAVYLMSCKVLITPGLVAALFGILGNYVGVNLFMGKGAKIVKPLMITVMIIFFIRIISEMI